MSQGDVAVSMTIPASALPALVLSGGATGTPAVSTAPRAAAGGGTGVPAGGRTGS
jgi:hypothetical protein